MNDRIASFHWEGPVSTYPDSTHPLTSPGLEFFHWTTNQKILWCGDVGYRSPPISLVEWGLKVILNIRSDYEYRPKDYFDKTQVNLINDWFVKID